MTKFLLPPLALLAVILQSTSMAYAAEEPLGRLFSSPRERATQDIGRQKFGKKIPDVSAITIAPAEEKMAEQITLDGYVRNSSGKFTAWINQTPQHGHENPQGITVLKPGRNQADISMQLPSGQKLKLKPGQTFEVTRGKVTEVYEEAATPVPRDPEKK